MPYPVNYIIRAGIYFKLNEFRAAITRMYTVTNTTGGGTGGNALAKAIHDEYTPLLSPLLANLAAVQGAAIFEPPPFFTVREVYVPGALITGTGGNDSLPPQTAGKITFRGVHNRARNAGRLFIPFPPEAENDPGAVPSANYLANLHLLANKIMAGHVATDTNPVFPFNTRTTTVRPILAHHSPINPNYAILAETVAKWATQRRRSVKPLPNTWPFG